MRTTNIAFLLGATALGCTPFLNSLDDTFGTHREDGTDGGAGVPGDGGTANGEAGGHSPPLAYLARYLKGTLPPAEHNTEYQFGTAVAAFGEAVAVNAPFEDLYETDAGPVIKRGGATYFYPTATAAPVRLVTPNVDVDDGWVRGDVEPVDWQARAEGWNSTALALNEKYLVIGVAGEDSGSPTDQADNSVQDSGAVYIYRRAAIEEKPQYVKPPFPTPNEWFGRTVVLSGKWLFVGAPLEASGTTEPSDTSAPAAGAVFLYEDKGDHFESAGYVKAPTIQAGDMFGRSIAADAEANALVIGSPTEDSASQGVGGDRLDDSSVGSGAAWVYRYDGATWNFEEYLKARNSPPHPDGGARFGDFFGFSVALSGSRIAVGLPNAASCDDTEPSYDGRGAVHVFARNDGKWTWTGCLNPHGPHRDAFGWTLGMTPEHLLVGAVWDSEERIPQPFQGTTYSGAAYLFDPIAGGSWRERQFVKAPNTITGDLFTFSLALTSDRFVAGAPWQTSSATTVTADVKDDAHWSGAAYVYTLNAPKPADAATP